MSDTTTRRRTALRETALTVGAVAGAICVLLAVAAPLLGIRLLVFESGSMSPTVETGGAALTRTVAAGELAVGDIVSVTPDSRPRVTHRIVGLERVDGQTLLTLQGDANQTPDPEPYAVTEADRVVLHVNHLGFVVDALASPYALLLTGAFVALLLMVGFRRSTGPDTPGRHRAPVAVVAVVAVGLAATGVLSPSRVAPTTAAFTDSAQVVAPMASLTVPVPAGFQCSASLANGFRFSWSGVPGATSYTVTYTNGSATVPAGTTTYSLPGAALGLLGAGDATVRANRAFGSPATTTWSSGPTATIHYTYLLGLLGLLLAASC